MKRELPPFVPPSLAKIGWPPQSSVFAENIRRTRMHYGWSQAELARRMTDAGAPMKANRVATIEAPGPHERTVSLDQAAAFAVVLRVRLETLLTASDPHPALTAASNRWERATRDLAEALVEYNAAREALVDAAEKDGQPYPADHWIRRTVGFEDPKEDARGEREEAT